MGARAALLEDHGHMFVRTGERASGTWSWREGSLLLACPKTAGKPVSQRQGGHRLSQRGSLRHLGTVLPRGTVQQAKTQIPDESAVWGTEGDPEARCRWPGNQEFLTWHLVSRNTIFFTFVKLNQKERHWNQQDCNIPQSTQSSIKPIHAAVWGIFNSILPFASKQLSP